MLQNYTIDLRISSRDGQPIRIHPSSLQRFARSLEGLFKVIARKADIDYDDEQYVMDLAIVGARTGSIEFHFGPRFYFMDDAGQEVKTHQEETDRLWVRAAQIVAIMAFAFQLSASSRPNRASPEAEKAAELIRDIEIAKEISDFLAVRREFDSHDVVVRFPDHEPLELQVKVTTSSGVLASKPKAPILGVQVHQPLEADLRITGFDLDVRYVGEHGHTKGRWRAFPAELTYNGQTYNVIALWGSAYFPWAMDQFHDLPVVKVRGFIEDPSQVVASVMQPREYVEASAILVVESANLWR